MSAATRATGDTATTGGGGGGGGGDDDNHGPDLILTNPTDEERIRTWKGSHPLWGAALSLDGYLERETRQLDIPLARNGGLTNWILTEASVTPPPPPPQAPPPSSSSLPSSSATPSQQERQTQEQQTQERPVLSSCETLKKRALVRREANSGDAGGGPSIREGTAHGVGSVFTEPEARGRGYAGLMMSKLAETLGRSERDRHGDALFSVLYSDIGKKFYADRGWAPFESNHIEWSASASEPPSEARLSLVEYDDLPALVEADEKMLRRELSRPSPSGKPIRVAILPDLDQIQWHLTRAGFVCEQLFPGTRPTSHGAVYTSSSGARVWVIWSFSYSGTVDKPEKNTLYILRLVVEEGVSDEELTQGLGAIVQVARKQASDWACGSVSLWNPDERLRKAAEINGGKFVVRQQDSITSLNWFGEGSTDDVEWVLNEKYAWC